MRLFKITYFAVAMSLAFLGCSSTTSSDGDNGNGGDSDNETTEYSLSVSTDPSDGGSVDPSEGSFEEGSEVTVEATTNDGYTFLEWSGDQESAENPLTFTISKNTELTANFEEQTTKYSLKVSSGPSEGGSVDPSEGTFEAGTEVTVKATANDGYNFSEWTGDQESAENPLTFTINKDTELTANFTEESEESTNYSLSVSADPAEGGSVEPTDSTYEEGTEVTVEVTPNEGWNFTGWSGDMESEENPLTFTISKNTELTANFEKQTTKYSLKVSSGPSEGGSVDPSEGTFEAGTEVTVKATASDGYVFSEWTGDQESTENPMTFTINNDTEITANFVAEYNFSASASPSEGGSVNPSSGTFAEGTEVTVEATSNDGWFFTGWSGDKESDKNPFTFTIFDNTSLTASFSEESKYSVTLTASDGQGNLELSFGQDAKGSDGFDEGLDKEAPPPPPEGALNAFFEINELNLLQDFRSNTDQQVEWTLKYQVDSGRDFELTWNLTDDTFTPGTLILTDENSSFEVNMFDQSSYIISGTSGGSLIINYSIE